MLVLAERWVGSSRDGVASVVLLCAALLTPTFFLMYGYLALACAASGRPFGVKLEALWAAIFNKAGHLAVLFFVTFVASAAIFLWASAISDALAMMMWGLLFLGTYVAWVVFGRALRRVAQRGTGLSYGQSGKEDPGLD